MKRWNKMVMSWESSVVGFETNIPVTDWIDPDKKFFHHISKISVTALPDRKGKVEIDIFRVSISPTTERENIRQKMDEGIRAYEEKIFKGFRSSDDFIHSVQSPEQFQSTYTIDFSLTNGEQFCAAALRIVRIIFESLGVEDNDGFRLARFKITQETFILMEKNAWITFSNWLRIQHRLPIFGEGDREMFGVS